MKAVWILAVLVLHTNQRLVHGEVVGALVMPHGKAAS